MNLASTRIAVLAGGPSCEREVSLVSGKAVFDALQSKGFDVVFLDPLGDFIPELKKMNVGIVFNALHGTFGEDGAVQTLLDKIGMPYTGCGAAASDLTFDKARTQKRLKEKGIPVPEFAIVTVEGGPCPIALPAVVKPAKAGSSVGISLVSKPEEYAPALKAALAVDDTALVERYVKGRELTVGILGGKPLPVVEVIAARTFYDYEAKYGNSGTRYEFPAKLTDEEARVVTQTALEVYRALGCKVMARVDILWDQAPFVLEANTIPGLTAKSLLPKAAQAAGIDFPALCVKILELSLNKERET